MISMDELSTLSSDNTGLMLACHIYFHMQVFGLRYVLRLSLLYSRDAYSAKCILEQISPLLHLLYNITFTY
jgi:hypothetical protein